AISEPEDCGNRGASDRGRGARYPAAAGRDPAHRHLLQPDGLHRSHPCQSPGGESLMPADLGVVWAVMKWPLAACLVLPPLLVYLGLHVVEREVIFVDLALAQVATLGTCVALLVGYHFEDKTTFWISLAVTFLGAALFSWSRSSEHRPVPQEAIIGITFVVAAAGVILMLS